MATVERWQEIKKNSFMTEGEANIDYQKKNLLKNNSWKYSCP